MERRKLPYIHILPRILIGVLVFGTCLSLLYVPSIAQNIRSVSELADGASPVPTATILLSTPTLSPTPLMTYAPTESPTEGPTQPPSDVVILSAYRLRPALLTTPLKSPCMEITPRPTVSSGPTRGSMCFVCSSG